MSSSHHGRRGTVKAAQAAGGVLAFVALAETAHVASVLAGPSGVTAGVAVICIVFAACWLVFRVRPLLHPARPARDCEPAAPAETRPPARIAA